jgi:predicted nucleotidyltransferase
MRCFYNCGTGYGREDPGMDKATMDTPLNVKKSFRAGKTLKEAFEERVQIIVDTILENVDNKCIKKVYLFGSYAYGRPNKDSDIDICIVFTDDTDITETYMRFAVPLFDKGIMPVDKLVYHESEFNAKKEKRGIVNTIVTKGRLLYG